jgi:hypothetical protein
MFLKSLFGAFAAALVMFASSAAVAASMLPAGNRCRCSDEGRKLSQSLM